MCGIIGYLGKDNAINKTISCLEKLEYRGYDSAGIAYIENNNIIINKYKGRISNLKNNINQNSISNLAIGHTRWATHGCATDINAHPHSIGHITLVHNGIIENYIELKDFLKNNGYIFVSDTDTEVACAYIDYLYKNNQDKIKILNKLKEDLKGSYAFGIIFNDELNTLYAIRHDSPLILGLGDNEYFIASDVPAILEYTNKYILLDNDEIVKINHGYEIYNNLKKIKKDINIFTYNIGENALGDYSHYMLKEINEQPMIIYNLLTKYLNNIKLLPDLNRYSKIDIVGCGSAYHSGLIGKNLIEQYANKEVNCYIASEYRYKKNFYTNNSLVILISQSGETADTLACLRKAKENNIDTLAIVNAIGSSISREAHNTIYTEAGPEIAVATTKAYTAQITILALLSLRMNEDLNNININEIKNNIIELINNYDYKKLADAIYMNENIFFLGRLIDYAIGLEGSLKLKEITYINSSCYPAGELKHGTISLIEKNTPVISIITDKTIMEKTISNLKEVKARGAKTIIITCFDNLDETADIVIKIPKTNKYFEAILAIIPLQLLSYFVALKRKCDVDKPRNLAKSVTVE